MEDKLKALHGILVKEGVDDQPYEVFRDNFSGDAKKQKALHEILVRDGIDDQPFDVFQANFFTPTEGAAKKKSGWLIRFYRGLRDGYSRYA